MAITVEKSADGSLTLPAEMLNDDATTRYSLERDGTRYVLSPDGTNTTPLTHDEWMERLNELAHRAAESWPEGLTAVDAVNAIRR